MVELGEIVAGLGSRPLVKSDYEPDKILTFPPQMTNTHILARTSVIDNSGNLWVNGFMAKAMERIEARKLRMAGESMGSIRRKLGVSKSSVSLWCRDIRLTKEQQQKLIDADRKGGEKGRIVAAQNKIAERNNRLKRFMSRGVKMVGNLNRRELFIVGIALYWAEGDKKNRRITFTNSDPNMIKIWMRWLKECLKVKNEDIYGYLGINQLHTDRVQEVEKYWSLISGIPLDRFRKVSLKKVRALKTYENSGEYFGTFNVRVRKSTNLNYLMLGLIDGISGFEAKHGKIDRFGRVAQR